MPFVSDQEEGISTVIVGATGLIGSELLKKLPQLDVPLKIPRLIASIKSMGSTIEIDGVDRQVHVFPEDLENSALFEGVDAVIFAAPADVVEQYAPVLIDMDVPVLILVGYSLDEFLCL